VNFNPRSVLVAAVLAAGVLASCSSGTDSASRSASEPFSESSSKPVSGTEPGTEPVAATQSDVATGAVGYGSGPCVAADGSAPQQRVFADKPKQCIDVAKKYTATMVTNKGTMVFDLYPDRAPVTVNSFVNLIRAKYYDGIHFHRVVPEFVLQAGDPGALSPDTLASAGAGGPGYQFINENPQAGEYKIGNLAMANAGQDTNGSQFFVISGTNGTQLPPQYSLFGGLTADPANLTTLQAIGALGVSDGPPSEPVVIESMTVTES
jgi:cyclophilin family peptidyl-prolyl cis-trans isomerase